jgi:hypothetical protein
MRAEILPGFRSLPEAAWSACFPGEAEGWAYYAACEAIASPALGLSLAAVFDDEGLIIAAPLFQMAYRLDTPLQGRFEAVGRWLSRLAPGLVEWRMLGIGSAFAERCHVALRPGLDEAGTERAVTALLDLVEAEAARLRAPLLAFKDLAAPEAERMGPVLRRRGYHAIRSLPVAALDLTGHTPESYLDSLSSSTRKDLRRKLKKAGGVRIEHRHALGELAPEIERLYESTRRNSELNYGDFEELPPGYFPAISAALGDSALFVLYWVGDTLAAFNLLLLEPTRVIDKFLGMTYPLAREHNLYAVSWMENVRITTQSGRALLQSGQTAYASKLRFGSHLVPSTNYARHRNGLLNRAIGAAAPWLDFSRWDPDLRPPRTKAE